MITGSVFTGNYAAINGGGLRINSNDSNAAIDESTVSGNTTLGTGGGAYLFSLGPSSQTTIDSSQFENNTTKREVRACHCALMEGLVEWCVIALFLATTR